MLTEIESRIFQLENSIRYYKKILNGNTITKLEREIGERYLKIYQDDLDWLILKQRDNV
jgi:hypothetical protein